ncbi:DUF4198 domain-containing protein [Sphingopyxis panaciterrae]
MILRLLPLCLLGVTTIADAHDFWLQPQHWQAAPDQPVGVTLQVGHGPDRQRSSIPARRIVRFEAITPEGRRVDLDKRLDIGGATQDATVAFGTRGAYLVVLETDNNAESHLPAGRFNAYLEDEGLTGAIAHRARTNRTGAEGAETYSRHAKTIVQVGAADPQQQARIVRPTGLTLEIVPEVSPLSALPGRPLPVRIYYRGRPLAGALVKLNDLDADAKPVEMQRSDANGRAIFTMPGKGSWQFNVIWTRPQPKSSLADFDTSFSSLSFGITR